jgi:hypothetical protein
LGALTLKSYPFEVRGWDVEKQKSIDSTDGFGSNTRIYVSNNQIVQIEPDYDSNTSSSWITDKGRQFFDGIFGKFNSGDNNSSLNTLNKQSWLSILNLLIKTVYTFEHCYNHLDRKKSLTIVFENASLEMLGLLNILSQNYSFLKVRRADSTRLSNDLESSFQVNSPATKSKLKKSNACFIVATNPRYEGFILNLSLRQRFLKGNFKCFIFGSAVNLTFPTIFLGSNLKTFMSIYEGNHSNSQDLKFKNRPTLLMNSEIFKRNDGKNLIHLLKTSEKFGFLNKLWNTVSILNPSIDEAGLNATAKFQSLTDKDILGFSPLYLINVNLNNLTSFKQMAVSKMLNYSFSTQNSNPTDKRLVLFQNSVTENNSDFHEKFKGKMKTKHFYLPTSMFYENSETFINTEGAIKKTNKIIFRNETKSGWQILRRVLRNFKQNVTFLDRKDNESIIFSSKKISNFRNYLNFQYHATQSLSSYNYYFNFKNRSFVITNLNRFKAKHLKFHCTKLKYWLDDFYIGGKDSYSQNSLVLAKSSSILRSESTNFF